MEYIGGRRQSGCSSKLAHVSCCENAFIFIFTSYLTGARHHVCVSAFATNLNFHENFEIFNST